MNLQEVSKGREGGVWIPNWGGEHSADLVLGPICAAQDVRPKVSGGKFTNEGAWRRAECNYKRYLRGGGEHLGTIMQERATTNTDDAYGYAENA